MGSPFDQLKVAIADRYLLERELGAGGMASVFLAKNGGGTELVRRPSGEGPAMIASPGAPLTSVAVNAGRSAYLLVALTTIACSYPDL